MNKTIHAILAIGFAPFALLTFHSFASMYTQLEIVEPSDASNFVVVSTYQLVGPLALICAAFHYVCWHLDVRVSRRCIPRSFWLVVAALMAFLAITIPLEGKHTTVYTGALIVWIIAYVALFFTSPSNSSLRPLRAE